MAKFAFEAKAVTGQMVKGELEAATEAEARVKLRAQKLIPIRVATKQAQVSTMKKMSVGGKVNAKELQIFTRQFSTLLSSGIPVLQSLDVLGRSSRSGSLARAVQDVSASVSTGKRLAEAMSQHPLVFDRFYVNMVRAGEESGGLDTVLSRLAVYIEKAVKIQSKVKGAMVYPAVILVVSALVVSAILIFVIPKFQDLFQSSGQELPMMTQIVIKLSKFFISYWYVLIGGVIALVVGTKNYYQTDGGRKTLDAIMIDLPLIGDLIQKGAIAKFSRTLGTLLSSGVGIMEAMDIASKVVDNYSLEMALVRARDSISEGKSIVTPLAKERYIPGMVTQMIGVGEQTGALDSMLNKIADFYEDEVDVAVSALTSVLEPLMMVVLGSIIAVLVVSMYLPIFNLAGTMGG